LEEGRTKERKKRKISYLLEDMYRLQGGWVVDICKETARGRAESQFMSEIAICSFMDKILVYDTTNETKLASKRKNKVLLRTTE
jgi:hypothetical protein